MHISGCWLQHFFSTTVGISLHFWQMDLEGWSWTGGAVGGATRAKWLRT